MLRLLRRCRHLHSSQPRLSSLPIGSTTNQLTPQALTEISLGSLTPPVLMLHFPFHLFLGQKQLRRHHPISYSLSLFLLSPSLLLFFASTTSSVSFRVAPSAPVALSCIDTACTEPVTSSVYTTSPRTQNRTQKQKVKVGTAPPFVLLKYQKNIHPFTRDTHEREKKS